jgi:hypothetical protein
MSATTVNTCRRKLIALSKERPFNAVYLLSTSPTAITCSEVKCYV